MNPETGEIKNFKKGEIPPEWEPLPDAGTEVEVQPLPNGLPDVGGRVEVVAPPLCRRGHMWKVAGYVEGTPGRMILELLPETRARLMK